MVRNQDFNGINFLGKRNLMRGKNSLIWEGNCSFDKDKFYGSRKHGSL